MNITDLHKLFLKHQLIDTDTRKIREHSIFFALKGENFNGNNFAVEALAKGASFAVVDDASIKDNDKIILVNDVLSTLQQLAKFHRKFLGIPIIALTGSNGKTTTKELINTILSQKYITCATKGNLNNHIGVPLTLLSMNNNTEIGIVEMGANHHNEIALLTSIVMPDFGYITNFGKAHLEGFGSLEGVIEAKSELYDYLLKFDKTIFVNPEDSIQVSKTKSGKCVFFDNNIHTLEVSPFIKLLVKDEVITTNLIGSYNINNIKVAITVGGYFKVDKTQITKALELYVPKNNRSQLLTLNETTVILDAYNANPTSMSVALENFNYFKATSKTVILGDMLELGKSSLEEHQYIVDVIESYGFNHIVLVGEQFYQTKTSFQKFKKVDGLKTWASNHFNDSEAILIKGSRGIALEKLLEFVKID